MYHSTASGAGRASHVFLNGNDLPMRWAGSRVFTIVELGFGLGLNFLATWNAWRRDPKHSARLHFVSIERHPFGPDDLAALQKAVGLPLGRDEASDRALDGADQCLHEIGLVDELEGDVLDRLLALVDDGVEQHRLEIDVRLVGGDHLELQFDREVLGRDAAVHDLDEGDLEIEPRRQDAPVFTEDGDDADIVAVIRK